MLRSQGNVSYTGVYRCVTCSATFTGLAPLLLHQSTHTNVLSRVHVHPSVHHNINLHETAFSLRLLDNMQPFQPVLLPENPAPPFYICDCGEKFQASSLMLEHRHLHGSTPMVLQRLDSSSSPFIREDWTQKNPIQQESLKPIVSKPHLALSDSSTSLSPVFRINMVPVPENTLPEKVNVAKNKGVTILNSPQDESKSSQDLIKKELEDVSATQEQLPGAKQDLPLQDKTISIPSKGISHGQSLPRNNLMKFLAKANKHCTKSSQSQSPSKSEVAVPIEITPATKLEALLNTNPSVGQLRQWLKKGCTKTVTRAIGRIFDSNKKGIVSLNKTLSPVVLLETRRKLIDPSCSNGTQGRYQCCHCHKVFQDLDNLIKHNFLHRKKRIKRCHHCKKIIIGKQQFGDKHICPQSVSKAMQQSSSSQSKFPFVQKTRSFHNLNEKSCLNDTRNVVFCQSCKHSYSDMYNLKEHKCQGPGSSLPQHATSSTQKTALLKSKSLGIIDTEVTGRPQISRMIAVGAEKTDSIKVEVTTANTKQSEILGLAWSGSAKSFSPFYPKAPHLKQVEDGSSCRNSLQEKDSNWDAATVSHEESDGDQSKIPLDDEMEVTSVAEGADTKAGVKQVVSEECAKSAQRTSSLGFIKDGVEQFSCSSCQNTYSRRSILRQHLEMCEFRSHRFGLASQNDRDVSILGTTQPFTNKKKRAFHCFVCGMSFSSEDNMLVHRKKCMLMPTLPPKDSVTSEPNFSGSGSEGQIQQDDGGNWGIMSLPSVLPRRVTCNCGAGFTSTRLLLEHLQKHAQESYTCPTCGETVSSWAGYEAHLQIHMQPYHLLYKGLKPQRS